MQIAFYAPMKPPDHPTPSGDRRIARLLWQALEKAGHEVTLASRFRAHDREGGIERQTELAAEGAREAARLIAGYGSGAARPDLWLTYHVYHKAPDWLGPEVAAALGIPYVIFEASDAAKRRQGRWSVGYAAAARAIEAADTVVSLTRHDMAGLAKRVRGTARLVFLPPFLESAGPRDESGRGEARARLTAQYPALDHGLDPGRKWLLSVAMMRPGDKLASYRQLAAALRRLESSRWQLLIVGDGEARAEVEAAFKGFDNVVFAGEQGSDALDTAHAAADLFVWPAVGEALGMAILEAQAAGLPVIAGNERGVPDIVVHGETGLLVPPTDEAALAGAIRDLLEDDAWRKRLAQGARNLIAGQRTLAHAVPRIQAILKETLTRASGKAQGGAQGEAQDEKRAP